MSYLVSVGHPQVEQIKLDSGILSHLHLAEEILPQARPVVKFALHEMPVGGDCVVPQHPRFPERAIPLRLTPGDVRAEPFRVRIHHLLELFVHAGGGSTGAGGTMESVTCPLLPSDLTFPHSTHWL